MTYTALLSYLVGSWLMGYGFGVLWHVVFVRFEQWISF